MVGLDKRLEQAVKVLIGDADAGVADFDPPVALIRADCGRSDIDRDPAPLREFDGVADEVAHDLLQAHRVAPNNAPVRAIEVHRNEQPLL